MREIFQPADILLPDFSETDAEKWSVIACDQFTGDPEYWKKTEEYVGEAASTLHLILPEIYLEEPDVKERIRTARSNMKQYLKEGILKTYENAMVYVERTQSNGIVRSGVVGKIDLEAYDFTPGSRSPIRATEATVVERIPPRVRVRAKARLESPHIMLLIDDTKDTAIGKCAENKESMELLYDTDLMNGGGHVRGYLMNEQQQEAFRDALASLFAKNKKGEVCFAMGDGNHSLATAKTCYEILKQENPDVALKNHPARYALVEVVNLHSDALKFEAIHRIVTETEPAKLINSMMDALELTEEETGQPITIVKGGMKRTLYVHKPTSNLAVGSLQNALDAYLLANHGKIDYIHGSDTVMRLAEQPNSVGFLLPDLHKGMLFSSVQKDGVLPRKTFSMGHAEDKRYYMECRKIR